MRWLVDGMNAIGSVPDGWWRDRTGAMRRLVAALEAFAGSGEDDRPRVVVILDGRPRDVGAGGLVEVAFAAGGRGAADDEIARRAAVDPDPEDLTVVTSDRDLAARVTAAGAHVEGVAAFRERLAGF